MAALERFLHGTGDGLSSLLRAGLAHVQFETIHPFLDGNGRIGRLLITLMLCESGMLREPLLYLSLYLKQHRAEYYGHLDRVRQDGDWEAWLTFFLRGVAETADGAVSTALRLDTLFRRDNETLASSGRRAGSALRVHAALKSRPILSVTEISRRSKLSFAAAGAATELLAERGIARELTGRRRNRLFAYDAYVAVLNEGGQPL